jgi:CRP-like cAMP-binding protein
MQPLFDLFAPNLLGNASVKKFPIDHVFTLGPTVGLVMEGVVAEDILLQNEGTSLTLRLVGPNDFLNLSSVLGPSNHYHQYVCETEQVVVALVNAESFRSGLVSKSPEVQALAAQELLNRCHALYQETISTHINMTDGEIDDRILWVLEKFQTLAGDEKITLRRKRIAEYLRVTPETVSRSLTRLESQGLLARGSRSDLTLLRTKK